MARRQKKVDTEWEQRLDIYLTPHEQLRKALGNRPMTARLLARYRPAVTGYLTTVLRRSEWSADAIEAASATEAIWKEFTEIMLRRMPGEWGRDGMTFRELMYQAAYEALNNWGRPATRQLMIGQADRKSLDVRLGAQVTHLAKERLRRYQKSRKNNLYCSVFELKERHPNESNESLAGRLAALAGHRRISVNNFSQILGRATTRYHQYVIEEAELLVRQVDPPGIAEIRRVLGELNLLEDSEKLPPDLREALALDG